MSHEEAWVPRILPFPARAAAPAAGAESLEVVWNRFLHEVIDGWLEVHRGDLANTQRIARAFASVLDSLQQQHIRVIGVDVPALQAELVAIQADVIHRGATLDQARRLFQVVTFLVVDALALADILADVDPAVAEALARDDPPGA